MSIKPTQTTPRFIKEALLRQRKWVFNALRAPWCWREPRRGAWHTLEDAYAVEQSLHKLSPSR